MMDTDRSAWMERDRSAWTVATVSAEFHCAVVSYFVIVVTTGCDQTRLTDLQSLDRDYELFGRGHGPSKLRSMLLVMVICNLV
jgi:hypothetical protein